MVTGPVRLGSLISVFPVAMLKNFSTLSISTSRKSIWIRFSGPRDAVLLVLLDTTRLEDWFPVLAGSLPPEAASATRVPVRRATVGFGAGFAGAGAALPRFAVSGGWVFTSP